MRRTWLGAIAVACFGLLASGAGSAQEKGVSVLKSAYKGWQNCYRMTNGQIELIATTDVGPRIIRFAFVGEDNIFGENPDQVGKTGGEEWRIYGGHRLWHAQTVRTVPRAGANVSRSEVEAGRWSSVRRPRFP